MHHPESHDLTMEEQWDLISKLNEIPKKLLTEIDIEFIHSVNSQFKSNQPLSGHQLMEMQGLYEYESLKYFRLLREIELARKNQKQSEETH
jgi:hypothetical protein